LAEATLTAVPDEATTPAAIPDQDQPVVEQEDADVSAFLEARTAPAGTEQGTESRTDTGTDDVEETARQAEIKAEAARQAEALRKQEREAEAVERERAENERRVEGINSAYRDRTARIAAALDKALVDDDTKTAILAQFNEHHAQSQLFHGSNFTNGLYQNLAKRLPEDKREDFLALRPKHKSYDDVIASYEEMKTPLLRDGYIAKADHEAEVAKAVKAFAKKLDAPDEHGQVGAGLRARLSKLSGSPPLVQGNNTASRDEELMMADDTPFEVALAIQARRDAALRGG
jgi:hypothetical protein